MNSAVVVQCIVCDGIIKIYGPELGTQVECPDCAEFLEVTSLDPLALGYAADMEEESFIVEDEHPRG